jgi:hypothetical protein
MSIGRVGPIQCAALIAAARRPRFVAHRLQGALRLFWIDSARVRRLRGGSPNGLHGTQFLQPPTPRGVVVIDQRRTRSRTAFGPLNRVVILRALDADEQSGFAVRVSAGIQGPATCPCDKPIVATDGCGPESPGGECIWTHTRTTAL